MKTKKVKQASFLSIVFKYTIPWLDFDKSV